MQLHLPNAKLIHAGHPILHQACHQGYRSASLILWVAWNDPEWKPLFTDPEYTDKYGKVAAQRIKSDDDSFAISRMKPGDPNIRDLRWNIRRASE